MLLRHINRNGFKLERFKRLIIEKEEKQRNYEQERERRQRERSLDLEIRRSHNIQKIRPSFMAKENKCVLCPVRQFCKDSYVDTGYMFSSRYCNRKVVREILDKIKARLIERS